MGLTAAVLRKLLALAAVVTGLVALLFGLHLLLTVAVPPLRDAWRAVQALPGAKANESRLVAALREQEARAAEAVQARDAALAAVQADLAAQRRQLDEAVASLRQDAEAAAERVRSLQADVDADIQARLARAREARDRICRSWNPMDWLRCRAAEVVWDQQREAIRSVQVQAEAALAAPAREAAALQARVQQAETEARRQLDVLGRAALAQVDSTDALAQAAQVDHDAARQLAQAARAQREALQAAAGGKAGWILSEWQRLRWRLFWIVVALLLAPYFQRTLWYFVGMRLVERAPAIQLVPPEAPGTLSVSPAVRTLEFDLPKGVVLRARPGHVRPVELGASTDLFYSWQAPFLSYAAGLTLLTRLGGDDRSRRLSLFSPTHPDLYVARADLVAHPGLVLHPGQIVGVLGDIELRTAWRLFSLHAWSTRQLRFVTFAGTGTVFLQGRGDLRAERVEGGPERVEERLVVGFDARLGLRTRRTATFLPYLLGITPLTEDAFEGTGVYLWQKSAAATATGLVERSLGLMWSAVGKLLGF